MVQVFPQILNYLKTLDFVVTTSICGLNVAHYGLIN